ncbi:hypothetical protein WICMUC_002656 [Wickerhamomyces mucosus]|uniref:protein-tyrosine-phosphatase n=1 Tax=Wickerhamomyces mucosus TaxID=1378264 RepID=A0A9P8PQ37_9ASCO|nr:hypothetical protein WICMUC_002656 [Wickerhamomyces mucosus]
MDRILGGLYISGYDSFIREGDILEKYNITHIVTVFKGKLPEDYYERFTIKGVEIDDLESENVLQYLDETNLFINKALFPDEEEIQVGLKKKHSTNIAIICQAGQSRSVSVLAAFLMKKYRLTLDQSLHAIQRKRELNKIRVNEGFQEQLQLFHSMGCKIDQDDPEYRQWKLNHSILYDPRGDDILSKDETFQKEEIPSADEEAFQIRCRKCRQHLAFSTSFVPHVPPGEDDKQSLFIRRVPNRRKIISVQSALNNACSHYFIEPLEWMKEQLQNTEELEGKFNCFKCDSRIGGYNWKGSRCSCGKWMVPAIYLQKVKCDEVRFNNNAVNMIAVNHNNIATKPNSDQ